MMMTTLAVTAMATLGCSRGLDLAPAATADRVVGLDDAARAASNDVEVVVQADDWPGDAPIDMAVTPLRVRIENRGDIPVRIRYADFELVGSSGETYRALPPYKIEGVVPRMVGTYDPIYPSIDYYGFGVAPPYSPVYPGMRAFSGPFDYYPGYYDNYYRDWQDLPTTDMLVRAIPEGVLQPGGHIEGYLYFQPVDADEETSIRFVSELVDADTGGEVARLTVPFVVGGG